MYYVVYVNLKNMYQSVNLNLPLYVWKKITCMAISKQRKPFLFPDWPSMPFLRAGNKLLHKKKSLSTAMITISLNY